MDCPICNWSSENLEYRFLYETRYWRVVLAPNQSLVGRCVVHLKRHAGDLACLTEVELLDWLEIVKELEKAIKRAFGAIMFNWSCYLNHAYCDNVPAQHIHWWAVPRYRQTVMIKDWCFDDPDFGNPYDHGRWLEVPKVVCQEIGEQIRNAL